MTRTRLPGLLAAIVTAVLALSACGGGGDPLAQDTSAPTGTGTGGAGSITVGSAAFPENELLAEIYAGALRKAGVQVDTRLNIGSREAYLKGLQDGSIDLIPEYTGGLLQYYEEGSTAKSSADVYAAVQQALPQGLTVLTASEAEDKDSLVVTQETAQQDSLTTISSLAPVASRFVIGGPPEWRTRPDTGVPALQRVYGLTFQRFQPLDTAGPRTVAALKNGQVQVANLFTTDPAVQANGFVVLTDDKNMFAAQNVVPLLREDAVTPTVRSALDGVSAALDTDTLRTLLSQVVLEQEDAADVAQQWLTEEGLG